MRSFSRSRSRQSCAVRSRSSLTDTNFIVPPFETTIVYYIVDTIEGAIQGARCSYSTTWEGKPWCPIRGRASHGRPTWRTKARDIPKHAKATRYPQGGILMQYAYPCVLTPEEDGGFSVSFPDVPEALTCGNDRVESLAMAEDGLAVALGPTFSAERTFRYPVSQQKTNRLSPCHLWSRPSWHFTRLCAVKASRRSRSRHGSV